MFKSKRTITILTAFVLALFLLVSAGFAAGRNTYTANLKGRHEVPPVDTNAQGEAIVRFNRDGSSLHYRLIVANIDDVVAAHIHCGEQGVNGPVGVTLFSGGPVSPDGILAEATVHAPDEGNACGWTDIEDVRSAVESGGAYVNVHTIAHPPGEIRGQLD